MIPAWPAGLPKEFETDGFQDSLPDQRRRSTIPRGNVQSDRTARRERTAPIAGEMLLTSDQWDALLTFHDDELGGGVLSFDFPDPDDPDATVTVAFTAPPELRPVGVDLFNASIRFTREE